MLPLALAYAMWEGREGDGDEWLVVDVGVVVGGNGGVPGG